MITNMLINALGQAIFESCGQALLIYVVLQIFMQLFPGIGSKYRYDINYLGLTIICCWFLANLVKIYLHNAAMPNFSPMLYSSAMAYGAPKHLPTLLQQAEAFITTYAKYITGLYMIGLMLHAFRLLGGFMHIAHIRKQKNLTQDSFWSAKAVALAEKLRMFKRVSLYFSEHVQIPLTIGHLKPIIIFPLALINNLDAEQVEAILLHELSHIKRYDYLMNIVQCVMETILCFNPFVWLISKTIRQEREYCCDDMVVDEDCDNYTYSKALFIIAQQNSQQYALAMASTGTRKYPLLNRIKRLNTMKTQDSLPKFHLLIIVAIASIGILLAWGIPQYSVAKTRAHRTIRIAAIQPNSLNVAAPAPPAAPIPAPAIAAPVSNKISLAALTDTATNKLLTDSLKHDKSKFKIVIEDDKGNKKEYNSISELPDSEKTEFLKENHSLGELHFLDSMHFADNFNFKMSPEWQAQMLAMKINGEKMRKQFNSPAWRKQMADMKVQIEKMHNSPEWKKQMEDMKLQGEKMREQFNSPEWKKQMEDMKLQSEEMRKKFDSPEWKKQMEDMKLQGEEMRKKFNSPEWKKQVEAMKLQSEKINKEVNSDVWRKYAEEMKEQAKKMSQQFNSPECKKQMEDMQRKIKDEVDRETQKAGADTTK